MSIGLSSAFLGVGGGLIIAPLLPLFVQLGSAETMATSLFVVMVTVFVNSFFFIKKRLVDWSCFFYMSLGAVVCSALLAYVGGRSADVVFRLGLVLALLMILLNPLAYWDLKPGRAKEFLLGSFGGCLTGLSGVGSAVFSPILFQFRWLEKKRIVPTVNAVMCVVTVGTLSALFLGHAQGMRLVHVDTGVLVLCGSFISSFAGRRLNAGPYEKQRRFLLKALVLALLIKMTIELVVRLF